MAIIKIDSINDKVHLGRALDYIIDEKKTEFGIYTDSVNCGVLTALAEFSLLRSDARKVHYSPESGRSEILGWHITQSFSPEDDITPEKALELGKEFMKNKFPDSQYVIATHVDKGHIHNHIIMNSVNCVTHKRLHTNKKNYYEMREVSDELCRKNNLSVIDKKSKTKTAKLRIAIDESIEKANSYMDFIAIMQELGYTIKEPRGDKYLSFKNSEMQKYIRSTSISLDYSKAAIKTRIESKNLGTNIKKPKKHRSVYDDKVKYSSKRKRLKAEIDNSIKKCSSFEEFKNDMKRKEFEVKDEFKHLAFKGKDGQRFIRSESIGFEYEEDVIRYRLEFKEEYAKMAEQKIPKVYDDKNVDGGLYEWMCGENSNILNFSRRFLDRNGLDTSNGIGDFYFYRFMQRYYAEKNKIAEKNNEIKALNGEISKFIKIEKAKKEYWSLKTIVKQYSELLNTKSDELNPLEIELYKKKINDYNNAIDTMNDAKAKYGNDILKSQKLKDNINQLMTEKRKLQNECTELKIEFQNWENIKYNFEYEYNLSEEKSIKAVEEYEAEQQKKEEKYQAKQQKKEARKEKIKGFFKLDR